MIIERDFYTEERYIDMYGRCFMTRRYKSGAMVIGGLVKWYIHWLIIVFIMRNYYDDRN